MSNITSMDYRRRTLGELQREVEGLRAEVQRLNEWRAWQEMITDTLEIQFSEMHAQYEFMLDNIVGQLRAITALVSAKGNEK